MILIVACYSDPVAIYFAAFLLKNKYKFLFVDQSLLGEELLPLTKHLRYKSALFKYEDFSGVYIRLSYPSEEVKKVRPEIDTQLDVMGNILHTKFKKIVNNSFSQASNSSKLYQLIICNLQKIRRPASYVIKGHTLNIVPGEDVLIYKSLSAVRSIPTLLSKDHLNRISYEPVLFQKFIHGHNIRVHVIEDTCFASVLMTSKVDYRYDKLSTKINYSLPKFIRQECCDLTKQLGLKFSGIDLIKCEGEYYLLEVNPSPGYPTFEHNFEISTKLAEILT